MLCAGRLLSSRWPSSELLFMFRSTTITCYLASASEHNPIQAQLIYSLVLLLAIHLLFNWKSFSEKKVQRWGHSLRDKWERIGEKGGGLHGVYPHEVDYDLIKVIGIVSGEASPIKSKENDLSGENQFGMVTLSTASAASPKTMLKANARTLEGQAHQMFAVIKMSPEPVGADLINDKFTFQAADNDLHLESVEDLNQVETGTASPNRYSGTVRSNPVSDATADATEADAITRGSSMGFF
jgi:hypothetical protein